MSKMAQEITERDSNHQDQNNFNNIKNKVVLNYKSKYKINIYVLIYK